MIFGTENVCRESIDVMGKSVFKANHDSILMIFSSVSSEVGRIFLLILVSVGSDF